MSNYPKEISNRNQIIKHQHSQLPSFSLPQVEERKGEGKREGEGGEEGEGEWVSGWVGGGGVRNKLGKNCLESVSEKNQENSEITPILQTIKKRDFFTLIFTVNSHE